MAAWQPVIRTEGVEGTSPRSGVDVPPVIRREDYEIARLQPSGAAASFGVAAARTASDGHVVGRGGVAVVETPFEGDGHGELLLVRHGEGLRAVLPDRTRSGRDHTVFTVPVSPGPGGDRGVLGTAGRWVLQKVVFALVDPVLGAISDRLVGAWEARHRPYRVRFLTPEHYRTPGEDTAEAGQLRPGRVLLLLHGPNALSHTADGFGGLPRDLVEHLCREYGRQVIAVDHPTLATDPRANAEWLATWLRGVGAEVEVDVLAHSRGGLVARLLVERPDRVGDCGRHVRFRSLTFAGTPHRGTPVADPEHLGGFVDRLLTLASPIPDNPVTTALEGALTVARQVATGFMGGLDGITCMKPAGGAGSAWLDAELGPGDRRPDGVRYRALAADFEPAAGSGIWHAVKDAGVDLVFGGLPNDVVVPTLSALSVGPQPGSGLHDMVVFDAHDAIRHGSYLGSDLVAPVLRAWLGEESRPLPSAYRSREFTAADVRSLEEIGPEWSLSKALDLTCAAPAAVRPGVQALVKGAGAAAWGYLTGRSSAAPAPVVVFLPGIMGSELTLAGERVWLSPWRLAHGGFGTLRLPPAHPAAAAAPGNVLCVGYRATLERLSQDFEVVAFPYDWRDDVAHAAVRLRSLLEQLLAEKELGGAPVHVVAHSMGGLVTRCALALDGATGGDGQVTPLIDRLTARGGRVVLAGTPNQGSFATPLALVGRHPVLSGLSRVDLRASLDDWLDTVWTFPGLAQLLPRPGLPGEPDGGVTVEWLYETSRWPGRDPDGAAAVLAAARRLHADLERCDGAGVHLILGDRVITPVAVRPSGTSGFEVGMGDAGDGTVARRCGELAHATTYYAAGVEHGNLVKDPRTLQAIVDVLGRGSTRLLSSAPRGVTDGVGTPDPDWVSAAEAGQRLAGAGAAGRGGPAVLPQVWDRREALDAGLDALTPFLGTAASRVPPLRLRVVHGDVECAHHPVLLAHATGTPIAGAEERCDDLLDDQLSDLQLLGLYPDTAGTWRFVRPRDTTARLKGCVVIGLDSGEPLSRGILSDLVSRAVVDYAGRVDDERVATARAAAGAGDGPPGDPAPLGLSSVAAGSGSAFGLGTERAIAAVVHGVQRANEVLAQASRPVVEELEFVDRYGSQIERIRWALDRLVARSTPAGTDVQAVVLDRDVVEGAGRREGTQPPEYDSGRWEHLSVDAAQLSPGDDDARRLTYRFARNRAAAGETPRRIDRSVVLGVLREAAAQPARSVELGRVLFEELLPFELKDELSRTDNLVMQLDERTADLPWELLGDRLAGAEPLACRVGLLRQLRGQSVRVRPNSSVPDTALVIGDPPTHLPRLPSARAEADSVAALLRGEGITVAAVGFPAGTAGSTSTANVIRREFWARDHRVVHIAAHGLYRLQDSGDVGGGVLIGPRTYLTADDFRNLRATPDLVFLNCCHLGRVSAGEAPTDTGLLDDVDQHVTAASLASALMRIGVKAVVVAGWQVDDQVASRFADEFYRRLIEGVPYGESVKQARMACYESSNGYDNTWAAYQCYGDPSFRLRRKRDDGRKRAVGDLPMRSVALRTLEDLRLRSTEVSGQEGFAATLKDLEERVCRQWPQDGALLASVAEAWATLGDYPRAIGRYAEAVRAEDGTAPLKALERLVNLNSRYALELHRTAPDRRRAEITDLTQAADRWMGLLRDLDRDTGERSALDGGNYKRLAILHPEGRDGYLRQAIGSYVASALDKPEKLYGFRNSVQLASLLSDDGALDLLEPLLKDDVWVSDWAADVLAPRPVADFWDRVGNPDSRLTAMLVHPASPLAERLADLLGDGAAAEETRRLIGGDLAGDVEDLAAAYERVRVGGFEMGHWRSTAEHVADLADLADGAGYPTAEPLRWLADRLGHVG